MLFADGARFPFYGQEYTKVFVHKAGYVFFEEADKHLNCGRMDMLSHTVISALCTDIPTTVIPKDTVGTKLFMPQLSLSHMYRGWSFADGWFA